MSAKLVRALGYSPLLAFTLCAAYCQSPAVIDAYSSARESIYEISVPDPVSGTTTQTAFKLSGVSGLITCLHGVIAQAADIRATNLHSKSHLQMHVAAIDASLDLARLEPNSASEFAQLDADGLKPIPDIEAVHAGDEFKVIGNPVGIRDSADTGRIGDERMRLLEDLAPVAIEIRSRTSPDLKTNVWTLRNSPVTYGDSGAPVMVQKDGMAFVIGVVDGGLLAYAYPLVWAVPVNKFNWTPVTDLPARERIRTILKSASGQRRNLFFGFHDAVTMPPPCEGENINDACLAASLRYYIDDRITPFYHYHEFYLWLDVPQSVSSQIENVVYKISIPMRTPGVTDAALLRGATPSIGLVRLELNQCREDAIPSTMLVKLRGGRSIPVGLYVCSRQPSKKQDLPAQVVMFKNHPPLNN